MAQAKKNSVIGRRAPLCVSVQLLPQQMVNASRRLVLNIAFKVEEVQLGAGRLTVGVTGGRLKLRIVNGCLSRLSLPTPQRCSLTPALSEYNLFSAQINGRIERSSAVATVTEAGYAYAQHGTQSRKDQHASEVFLSTGGGSQEPFWDFDSKMPRALSGECVNQLLGELSMEKGGEVHAEFETSPQALWISGSERVWPARMTPNHRIVRRLIVWRWLRSRLKNNREIVRMHEH